MRLRAVKAAMPYRRFSGIWGCSRQSCGGSFGLMFSLDRSKNDTSVTLDLMRAVAAQMVCVGHALFFSFEWRPAQLPYMQNVGVLLFFVLSGFWITSTLIERSKDPAYGFWRFFVDRFARIYSGLGPALVLIVLIDGAMIYLKGAHDIARYDNWQTLVANLFMLEGYRGAFDNLQALQWSTFGSAAPLWTLAIEWHIYMFVGALFFMVARPRSIPYLIPVVLVFGQSPIHYLFGALQPDGLVGQGLFALWLGGACVFLAARTIKVPFPLAVILMLISAACYVSFTSAHHEYNFRSYAILLIFVVAVVMASQANRLITSARLIAAITFFAGYSFTLYLVHHTILTAVSLLWPDSGWAGFICSILLSNILAAGIAMGTEMKHKSLARFLLKARLRGSPDLTVPSEMPEAERSRQAIPS